MKRGEVSLAPRQVRARRGAKLAVDPWAPPRLAVERERQRDGSTAPAVAVFLTGAECPYSCIFCDLWRYTLDGPTPRGALPRQLGSARDALGGWPPGAVLKLYNAANFFAPRAVPEADHAALAAATGGVARVVVECHPHLVDERVTRFAARVAPARLEVAMGLESADPRVHAGLGKGTAVGDFAGAAQRLASWGCDWRAFVLVGPPGVAARQVVDDAIATADWAARHGAAHVALIPLRQGNGTLERLAAAGTWSPPGLAQLEAALAGALAAIGARSVVTADLWDLGGLSACAVCFAARRARLERLNLTARPEPEIHCEACR